MDNLIIAISVITTFVIAFFMCFFAYRQGLKDGINLKNDKQIEKVLKKNVNVRGQSDKETEHLQKQVAERLNYINNFEVK